MRPLFAIMLLTALLGSETLAQFEASRASASIFAGYGGGGLDGNGALPVGAELNILRLGIHLQAGIMAGVASTNQDYAFQGMTGKWAFTSVVLAVKADYHFHPGRTFDPFVGVAFGHNAVEEKWSPASDLPAGAEEPVKPVADGFFFNGHAGLNIWFTPSVAFQARVGYFPYLAGAIVFSL